MIILLLKLKTLKDFESLCALNITKKLLVLKSPYKNVINSVWKIFPNNKSKTQTFTLISSKSYNKKISIYSYYNYTNIKNIVEEIQKQLLIERIKCEIVVKDKDLDKLSFQDNWILDCIYFLTGNYSKKKNKRK